jgi:hemerythrin-like domain-containing protein
MSSVLFPGPAAGFDEPIEMLEACHQRVQRMVALLERLAPHLAAHGSDEQARQAAADLTRYFDTSAVHHHDDEERHVLPLLVRLGHPALAQELFDAHRALGAAWARIRDELAAVQAGQPLQGPARPREQRWQQFAQAYRAHIALEEGTVFPLVAPALDDALRRAMGEDMAVRRGAPSPPSRQAG